MSVKECLASLSKARAFSWEPVFKQTTALLRNTGQRMLFYFNGVTLNQGSPLIF